MPADKHSTDVGQIGQSIDILEKWNPESDVALVGFSGFWASDFSRFHFIRSTDRFPVNKIYLRDSRNAWYHLGLSGRSADINGTKQYLESAMESHGIRKRVLTGASSGGYAALLFGWLLEADDVLAVAPRTFLDLANRWRSKDVRLLKFALRLAASGRAQREYFDLRTAFRSKPQIKTRVSIFYDETDATDSAHAERLGEFPFVCLHRFKGGGHLVGVKEEVARAIHDWLEAVLGLDDAASTSES